MHPCKTMAKSNYNKRMTGDHQITRTCENEGPEKKRWSNFHSKLGCTVITDKSAQMWRKDLFPTLSELTVLSLTDITEFLMVLKPILLHGRLLTNSLISEWNYPTINKNSGFLLHELLVQAVSNRFIFHHIYHLYIFQTHLAISYLHFYEVKSISLKFWVAWVIHLPKEIN